MAGVGLCQTFPWGSGGSRRGCFSKPEFAAWGLSTNPRPRSGSKKGPGTHKGHAGPSGSRGEQPAGCCDVSAHRCQLCWSQFAKTGCMKRLGNAWKEARLPLRKDQNETGTTGESGGSGVQGKEPQRQKALGKVLGSQTHEPRHAAKHLSHGSHCLKRAFEEKLGSTNTFLLLPLEGKLLLHSRVLHPTWRRTLAGGLVTASSVGNGGLGVSMRKGIQTCQAEGRGDSALLPTLLS